MAGADSVFAEKGKITLDEFLSDENFWGNFEDTSQIPRGFLRDNPGSAFSYDPYNKIVGHERDKAASKSIIMYTIKQYVRIRLLREALKKRGLSEDKIIDTLRKSSPPMPMIIRFGPYGSSKTKQQECEEEFMKIMRKKFGLTGYDYYVTRKVGSPLEFAIVEKQAPFGEEDVKRYDRRERLKGKIKVGIEVGAVATVGIALTYYVIDQTLQYDWLQQFLGWDWPEWVIANFSWMVPEMFYASVPVIGAALAYQYIKNLNKNKSKKPRLLLKGRDSVDILLGNESKESLIGKFEERDCPPQDKLTETPQILNSNEKILSIENLHAMDKSVQRTLSQIIEEKVVDVVGNSNHRKFFYSLISAGINTEKLPMVDEALKNRINYAQKLYVQNAVQRGEEFVYSFPETNTTLVNEKEGVKRSQKNERHLRVLLADILDGMGGRPWKKEACDEFVDYCSRLADSADELHISRRVIALPKTADNFAREDNSAFVTAKHVSMAEKESKSLTQLAMAPKIRDYISEHAVFNGPAIEVGRVNVLLSYSDETLKGMESGTSKTLYDYMQTEDYIGYVVPITARHAKAEPGKAGCIELVSEEETVMRKAGFYENALRMLFNSENIDLSKYNISVSVPALKEDDALLAGLYVAIKSSIEERPLRQDVFLAAKLLETGQVTSLQKLNCRLFYASDYKNKVIISEYDNTHKAMRPDGQTLYPTINLAPVRGTKDLLEMLTEG